MKPQARKKGGMMFGGGAKKFATGGGPISGGGSRTQGGSAPMGSGTAMSGVARTPTQGGPGSMGPAVSMGGMARTPTQGSPGSMGPATQMGDVVRTPGSAQMSNLPPNVASLAGRLGNLGVTSAMAKGGSVESKKMMRKEVAFMKKGAPKSMIKHEEAEAKGMKRGGMACGGMKKYAAGGMTGANPPKKPYTPTAGDINEKAGGDQEVEMRMERGYRPGGRGPLSRNGMRPRVPGYARGGGVESHGKTKGTMIKMASGGSVSARADGVAQRGKTNCKIC